MALRSAAAADDAGPMRRVVVIIAAAHFFSHFYILVLPPLFGPIARDLGVGAAALGIALAVFNITTMIFQPPLGFLVDRIGPGRVLIAGQITLALAIALIGVFPSFTMLLVLMAVAGIGNAVYHPADYAVLAHHVGRRWIGRAFGIHTFGGFAGFAVAPPVMVALTALLDWRQAFIITGTVGVLFGLFMLLWRDALDPPSEADAAPAARKGEVHWRSSLALLSSRPVMVAVLFFILLTFFHTGYSAFTPIVLERTQDFALVAANLPLTVYLTTSAAGVLVGGLIADITGRHGLVVAVSCAVVALIAALEAGFALPLWLIVTLFGLAGLASGIVAPSRDILVRALAPADQMGKVFGVVTTGFNIGGLIAPPVFGLLIDAGAPNAVFWLTAATALATAALVLVPSRQPDR